MNTVAPGFLTVGIEKGTDTQGLQKTARSNVGGEIVNRSLVCFGLAHVVFVDFKLVERYGFRRGEGKFRGGGLRHGRVLLAGVPGEPLETLSRLQPFTFPH